jgi:hypothetical protein
MAPPAAAYVTRAGASDTEFTPLGVVKYIFGLPGPSGFGSRSTADQARVGATTERGGEGSRSRRADVLRCRANSENCRQHP